MSQDVSLVKRLISFLKKPSAPDPKLRAPVHNAYDDYAPQTYAQPDPVPNESCAEPSFRSSTIHSATHGSRLDALVLRALQQFNAPLGFVIRYDTHGRMRYCTGRDYHGRYVDQTDVRPDRRALSLALDTGESQLLMHRNGDAPSAVLCGPLWVNDEVVGVLYLDNPARSRLHRGVFDLFCQQAARMLDEPISVAQ